MQKSIELILAAALLAAPAAFAQAAEPGSPTTSKSGMTVKPSADTPAKQKERNQDYSKVSGKPGSKSGPAENSRR